MTEWKHTLNLLPEWTLAADERLTIQQMAGIIAERLRRLDFSNEDYNHERDDIAEAFEGISADDETTDYDFGTVMNALYDFGDTQVSGAFFDAVKLCWVKTC